MLKFDILKTYYKSKQTTACERIRLFINKSKLLLTKFDFFLILEVIKKHRNYFSVIEILTKMRRINNTKILLKHLKYDKKMVKIFKVW